VPVGARLVLVSRPEESGSLLLRILAGLVRPIAGTFSMAGLTRPDDSRQGWARRVGYVGPQPAIYPWLSPMEALRLSARLGGLVGAEVTLAVHEVLERFHLEEAATRPLGRSGPLVAQRTALAAALITDPEVLLLDEPLRSLDPDERTQLLQLAPRRRTVVFASRYPASEEGIVNQVALIRDGRLAMHARVADLATHHLPLSTRGVEALADRLGAAATAHARASAAPPAAAST